MTIRAVLFDLDGTLLETTPLIIRSFQHAFQTVCRRTIQQEEVFPFFGKPLRAAMEELEPGKADELLCAFREYNLAHHDDMVTMFPGIEPLLADLQAAGLRLAIVTSKTSRTARRGLALFDLEKYFDVFIGMEDCTQHKPHPEPVLTALRQLHLPPENCLMVGDSPFDIESAHRAGVRAAAVRWSHVDWNEVMAAKPEYIIDEINQLKPICDIV